MEEYEPVAIKSKNMEFLLWTHKDEQIPTDFISQVLINNGVILENLKGDYAKYKQNVCHNTLES